MQSYVVGFSFSCDLEDVILLKKNRPVWQAGRLNGVGGKIEPNESPLSAMQREFAEETGIVTKNDDWNPYVRLSGTVYDSAELFQIVFFWHIASGSLSLPKEMRDEQPVIIGVEEVSYHPDVIPNLRWLIPLARSCMEGHERSSLFLIEEHYDEEALRDVKG